MQRREAAAREEFADGLLLRRVQPQIHAVQKQDLATPAADTEACFPARRKNGE